ncbi:MAG: ABC transporter ATP-binding protein [Melioribacteraceae bacterium]|nr:ABC transporter ATP-binding protein [Melioribacteraceae bacterium]
MNIIEINNLSKHYNTGSQNVFALNELSISVKKDEFLAVMGPSGSGKSTLLTALGGLCEPTAGSIKVDEIELYDLDNKSLSNYRREYIGFVFQSFQLLPYLTVKENIILPLITVQKRTRTQNKLALNILAKVGLKGKENRLIEELSGGEQQRVAIARALINDPVLILADEPTGNLDSETGKEILDLLEELNAEGRTIIIVTHDQEVKARATRTINLKDGMINNKIAS